MSLGGLPSERGSPVALFSGDVPTLLRSDPKRGGDGKVRINPDKQRVPLNWIAASFNGAFPFTVPASGTRKGELTVGAQGDRNAGDFEVSTLLFRSEGICSVIPEVRTPTLHRILSNVAISTDLVFGTSQLPGLLNQSIFCLPKTSWYFTFTDLSGSDNDVEPVLFGRRFDECGKAFRERLHRMAEMLRWCHPVWIGPEDPSTVAYTGAQIILTAGQVATITFPIGSAFDFLLQAFLDGSTYVDGTIPAGGLDVVADVKENASGRSLFNASSEGTGSLGMNWQNSWASPSPRVTGFNSGGIVRAFSLRSPRGCYEHIVPRNEQIVVRFENREAQTVRLRVALFGLAIYANQPADRRTSADGSARRDREAQAREFLDRIGDRGANVFATGPRGGGA